MHTLWGKARSFLKKLKLELLYDPAFHSWVYVQKKKQNQKHLKKKHAYIEKNTCTAVFIAALFIIKIKCPSTGELIHIHTYTRKMEFYSVIKKNH